MVARAAPDVRQETAPAAIRLRVRVCPTALSETKCNVEFETNTLEYVELDEPADMADRRTHGVLALWASGRPRHRWAATAHVAALELRDEIQVSASELRAVSYGAYFLVGIPFGITHSVFART